MKTTAYKIERNSPKEEGLIFFDEEFFNFVEDEMTSIGYVQKTSLRTHIHRNVIQALVPNYFNCLPLLISRIIKQPNGNYELILLENLIISIVTINLKLAKIVNFSKAEFAVDDFEVSPIESHLPPELAPESNSNINHLLQDYIQQFQKKKTLQREDCEQGKRFSLPQSEKEPEFIPPIALEDISIASVAACIEQFKLFLTQLTELTETQEKLHKISKNLHSILATNNDDVQLKQYITQQLDILHIPLTRIESQIQICAEKEKLANELLQNFSSDENLKAKFLEYITTFQYLDFFKSYLAWALHFIAYLYHAHIQEETENENRLKKFATFQKHFAVLVNIDKNHSIPNLLEFNKSIHKLNLDQIAVKINYFLKDECNTSLLCSSDKQKIFTKTIISTASSIQTILSAYDEKLNFLPFQAWEKGLLGLSPAGFNWSKESEELEKRHNTLLQEIIDIAAQDSRYKNLTEIYTRAEEESLTLLENTYPIALKNFQNHQKFLYKKREEKYQRILQLAHEIKQKLIPKLEKIKAVLNALQDDNSFTSYIQIEHEINKLTHEIESRPLVKIEISTTPNSKHIDLIDTNLDNLKLIQNSCNTLLQNLQRAHKEKTLQEVIASMTKSQDLINSYLSDTEASCSRIKENLAALGLEKNATDQLLIKHNCIPLTRLDEKFSMANGLRQFLVDEAKIMRAASTSTTQDYYAFHAEMLHKISKWGTVVEQARSIYVEIDYLDAIISQQTALKSTEKKIIAAEKLRSNFQALVFSIENKQQQLNSSERVDVSQDIEDIQKIFTMLHSTSQIITDYAIQGQTAQQVNKLLTIELEKTTALVFKIKSRYHDFEILNKRLTLTLAAKILQQIKKTQEHTTLINFEFYDYLHTDSPLLAKQILEIPLEHYKRIIDKNIQNNIKKSLAEYNEICRLGAQTSDDMAFPEQKLQDGINNLKTYLDNLSSLERTFIIKLHQILLPQARSVSAFLRTEMEKYADENDAELNLACKNFNEILLQLEQLLHKAHAENHTSYLAAFNQSIIEINRVLILLHQSYKEAAKRYRGLLGLENKTRLEKLARNEPNFLQRHWKKMLIGAGIMTVVAATSVITGGIVALGASSLVSIGILGGATLGGGLMGAAAGAYTGKITEVTTEERGLTRFIKQHRHKLVICGKILLGTLVISSLIALTAISFGIAPLILSTVGAATAASIAAISSISVNTTMGAFIGCGLMGISVVAAGSTLKADARGPISNQPESIGLSTNRIQYKLSLGHDDPALQAAQKHTDENAAVNKALEKIKIACDEIEELSEEIPNEKINVRTASPQQSRPQLLFSICAQPKNRPECGTIQKSFGTHYIYNLPTSMS